MVIIMVDNKLKYCREELEMTQTELGYVFGVQKATISNWENGYDIITLPKLIKFCSLYNYSLDYVCGLSNINQGFTKIDKLNKAALGSKLKKIRKELGLTQNAIADECAISRETYCHYELGINLISTLALYTICKNHKLSMDSIIR